MARSLACWHQLTGWTVRVLVSEVVDGRLAVDGPAGALRQRREAPFTLKEGRGDPEPAW